MRLLGASIGLTFVLAIAFAQPAMADGVDRTYPVGEQPGAIAIDPSDSRVYVANRSSSPGSVSRIDPASGEVTSHATSGGTPSSLALDAAHRRLYVSNFDGTFDVFDVTTMTIVATLPVNGIGVAVDAATQRVYVSGSSHLTVIDGATNTVVATKPAANDEDWFSVALDTALHRVYVTNPFSITYPDGTSISPSLIVLDDRDLSVVAELPLPIQVRWAIGVDGASHRVYLAGSEWEAGTGYVRRLLAFDGVSLDQVGSVDVAGEPIGMAVGAGRIYLTSSIGGYHVLDAGTIQVLQSFTFLPMQPFLPALDSQGRLLLGAAVYGDGDVVLAISSANHAPLIQVAQLLPSAPTTDGFLNFAISAVDGDFQRFPGGERDPVTLSFEWAVNGNVLPGETGSVLDLSRPGAGDRGDTIAARVTARDPEGLTTSASASVVVANAPPVPTATLSSTSPSTNDVLTATASAFDADGDPVTFAFAWLRNGAVIPGATTSSLDLATQGDQGDVIEVRVTASDDHGGVQVATASALVLPVSGSFLYLNSQPGDFVGRGLRQLYMSSDSAIQGWLPQGGDTFRADITQGTTHYWRVFLAAPAGVPLAVGTYTGAARSAFRPAGTPGLDVSGDGRGCNTLTGQFTVSEIAYSQYNELMLLDATFEQHCEGATPALLGRIRVEIPPPTPGVTLPVGSVAVPTSGNFLYLHSEPAEYVGQGNEVLYTSADSKIYGYLPEGGDYFRGSIVQGNNTHWWYVDIAAPPGEPLAVGSYIRAVRAAFRPAGSPGLDVYGDGRQCSTSNAKFDIDELTFAFGELVVFQATFQQPCGTGSLYGRIRIEIPAPSGPGITLPVGSIAVPTSGSFLYLNSEPGEYVGRGIEQLYTSTDSTITGSFLTQVRDYFRGNVVQGNNVHWWMVDIAAPAGEPLAVGNYLGAARASFRPAGSPGLDVAGDGRGYNDLVGRFDVDELSFWPNGELKVFQATFRVGGAAPKLYGRFRLETPPPLQLGVTIRDEGSVTNKTIVATIGGVISCSTSAPVDLSGTLTQTQAKGVVVSGAFSARVDCTAPSVAWSANVLAENGKFIGGSATATVTVSGCRTGCTTASATRSVKLNLGKS
jgi:hypothetical protein